MTALALPLRPLASGLEKHLQVSLDQLAGIRSVVGSMDRLDNVFLVACGGSLMDLYPVHHLLAGKSAVPAALANAGEFVTTAPAMVSDGSLVLLVSATGSTPETVAAAKWAQERGATVVSIVKEGRNALAASSDLVLDFATSRYVEMVPVMQLSALLVGLAVIERTTPTADVSDILQAYEGLPAALPVAVAEAEEVCERIAVALYREDHVVTLGAGPNYGAAYGFALCFLMEMQWISATPFHASEFLHGAMEMVTEDTPALLLLGEDDSRPLAERTQRFLDTYSRRAHYLDTKALSLPGIDQEGRGYVTAVLLGALIVRLAEYFEALTGHHLDIRRYMFRVDY